MKIKVMSIFGTRPEASKMAPIIKELEKRDNIESTVVVTAQHREMLDQILETFEVVPDFDLDIMQDKQTLTGITTKALEGIENVLLEVRPDIILVHGDTSTTFSGALAAFYGQVNIGHVEAGLRTYNKFEPYPEEMNRLLTTSLADIHFAPTVAAKENLLKENIDEDKILITGNTAVDCLNYSVIDDYQFENEELNQLDYDNKRIILMTAHRRENLGEPLEDICHAAREIAEANDDVEIVYAVHYNPVVQETAKDILGDVDNVLLTNPLSMLDMHNLMKRSHLIMSDSGGLQEEAPGLEVPVVVLRNVTERPEGIDAGTLVLAGTDKDNIIKEVTRILEDEEVYTSMAKAKNPFGDGQASKRIVDGILYHFNEIDKPEDFII